MMRVAAACMSFRPWAGGFWPVTTDATSVPTDLVERVRFGDRQEAHGDRQRFLQAGIVRPDAGVFLQERRARRLARILDPGLADLGILVVAAAAELDPLPGGILVLGKSRHDEAEPAHVRRVPCLGTGALGYDADFPDIGEFGVFRIVHRRAAPFDGRVDPGPVQHRRIGLVVRRVERGRLEIGHQPHQRVHRLVAFVGVDADLPAAGLHLVEPVAAVGAQHGDEDMGRPEAALQGRADYLLLAAVGQDLGVLDRIVPGERRLDAGLVEDVDAVELELAVAVRRQAVELAALGGRLVAVEVEHVLRDVGQDVLLVGRVLVEIGLERLERMLGDELRHEVVVFVDDVVAIAFGGHGDRRFRQHVGDRLGNDLHLDVGELLLEEGIDAALGKFPALTGRCPGNDRCRSGPHGRRRQSQRARADRQSETLENGSSRDGAAASALAVAAVTDVPRHVTSSGRN